MKLKVDGEEVVQAGIGDGPVDATIQCIKKAVAGVGDIQLEEYHVDAITGGTDALVEVLVKLQRRQDDQSRGNACDIIMAWVEAMLNGIKRLILRNFG